MTREELVSRAEAMLPAIRQRGAETDAARTIPTSSVEAFLDAGFARILLPRRWGGYELGIDTWLDVVSTIGKADGSHAWCAALMIHHPHYVAQFPEEAQRAIFGMGPDVAIAGSIHPKSKITAVDGGYRITGKAPFASGINHSSWAFVGGFLPEDGPPQPALFMLPRKDFEIIDVWQTVGMRGTGSNVIVTEDVFVPASRMIRLVDMLEGKGPGTASNTNPMYASPLAIYAPLTFAAPMLGAAQGAMEAFQQATVVRKTGAGRPAGSMTTLQVGAGRAAADIDAAELLLRRVAEVSDKPEALTATIRSRSMRDSARAAELLVGAIDEIIKMSGTAGFMAGNVIQRAWHDIHLAAQHISLSAEPNLSYWGQQLFGVERDPTQPFY